jgi:hypothetical protein
MLFAALSVGLFIVATAFAAPRPTAWKPPVVTATAAVALTDDPDLPGGLVPDLDKGTYMQMRDGFLRMRFDDAPYDQIAAGRLAGVAQLRRQVGQQAPFAVFSHWTALGPFPIPNGQTTGTPTAVSGRVTAIAVHPTNPDLVYLGLAQGGVWRSTDGGLNWTPLFDQQATLAIGALALAPSDPSVLYVGTGEANLSGDSYFGLGLYRIDQAGGTPVVSGPFNPTPTTDIIGAKCFTGRAISKLLVDPADPAIVYASTTSGIGGLNAEAFGSSPPITALRGIYRSTNGTSASPSFTKLTVSPAVSIAPDVSGNMNITDMVFDPLDASGNTLVCWALGTTALLNGGIYRTTTAKAATPTFSQTFVTTVSNIRASFATTMAGFVPRIYAATGETGVGTSCATGSGAIRVSADGGVTWSAKLLGGGGFCGGQCFYDLPIAVSPTNENLVLIGGAGNGTCSRVFARSTDGAASFSAAGTADFGMHADAHAIVFAPSNPAIVYEGNDGGVYRSNDGGASWTSRNTAGLSATQFQSIAIHPVDATFSIGGTQDNGTNMYQSPANWQRADFGDGGNTIIDQNAPDVASTIMYHTYFNQRNSVVAYARVDGPASAFDGNWFLFGQNLNGLLLSENPNFYAPLVRGPGNPNTIYYATDRLHRSADGGFTNPVVSQAPIAISAGLGVPISAVAIAASNDNVRLVGLNNTTIWGTVTGSSTLVNFTNVGMPVHTIGRIAIDPTNPNVAFVCYGGFNLPAGQHVWKCTDLLSGVPTFLPSGTGLPDVPVNAFVIDPVSPTRMWAGTDVGVYESTDGGAHWLPFTTGMPVVAVFDMALQNTHRILRVATHGRGMFDRIVDTPVATQLALVGAEIVGGHPRMTWYSADGASERMRLYRRAVPEDWVALGDIYADGTGSITYEDQDAARGRSYEYRIGILTPAGEKVLGQVWVDVPMEAGFALKRLTENPAKGVLTFSVTLTNGGPATLELVDVAGRRLSQQDLSSLGAGDHTVQMDAAAYGPGVYWARLSQASRMISTRLVLMR